MGASLMLLALIARASQRITRLPHIFGAVAQETLLIYFVHLCIVYGSIWNRGLAQIYGPTLGPGRTVVCVVLLLAAMVGLACTGTGGSTRGRASRAGRPWGLAVCSCTAFFNSQRLEIPDGQPTSKPRQQSH